MIMGDAAPLMLIVLKISISMTKWVSAATKETSVAPAARREGGREPRMAQDGHAIGRAACPS